MNSDELWFYLSCFARSRNIDYYVLAADELSLANYDVEKDIVIVANTDRRGQIGRHWVSWYMLRRRGEFKVTFFDSYGQNATCYGINVPFKMDVINTKCLQDDNSSLCGQYALMFIRYMIRGFPLVEFLNLFTKGNTKVNDQIVLQFYNCIKERCKSCPCIPGPSIPKMGCECKRDVRTYYSI